MAKRDAQNDAADEINLSVSGVPIKVDPSALRLTNFIKLLTGEAQYRILMRAVVHEVLPYADQMPDVVRQDLVRLARLLDIDIDGKGKRGKS